ncbi:unnamed protein product [Penicillium salamii]|nr:unnamed protein product [Penicillium salamii]CAG7985449.1 unnamed protein product [Penicillium salamii]CAG8279734.1 unnamed protein product [Penicillium salamii]
MKLIPSRTTQAPTVALGQGDVHIMDPSIKGNEYQAFSIASSTNAISGPSLTPCGSCNPLVLPKDIKSVKGPRIPLKASDLSELNAEETVSSGGQKESPAHSEIKAGPTIDVNKKKPSGGFIKQNQVRQSTLGPCNPKARASVIPARLKHRALACHKVMKLWPRTYRGARKLTAELCKAKLRFLRNHVKDQSDLFSDGEALLHEIASAYPKYNQIIRALPMLVDLVPGELKEKMMATGNMEMLKIGALLVKEWTSGSVRFKKDW